MLHSKHTSGPQKDGDAKDAMPSFSAGHRFNGLGISPNILHILAKLNFPTPAPIQYRAIPEGVAGKDVVGVAQTGTGKTLAFGIPLPQRLAAGEGRGLILVPP